jgi:decaprenyl-phosphate phosphoribosyltransferase
MFADSKQALVQDYLHLGRPDHWVKNLFLLPGFALGMAFVNQNGNSVKRDEVYLSLMVAFTSLCLASSANYTINEWLDRSFDQHHPEKRYRPSVVKNLSFKVVWCQYIVLTSISVSLANLVSREVLSLVVFLLFMGFLYNVKPFRLKDRYYLDVISESVNNPIRVAIGWYIVIENTFFPSSAFIAFWATGIFLMSLKRFTEMITLGDSNSMVSYRKSFRSWTPDKLLKFSFTGAITATTFLGVLLAGYKLEYILLFPSIVYLFQYYLGLALTLKSEVTAPEDLWKNNWLNLQIFLLMSLSIILSFIEIPVLHNLVGFGR